MIGKLDIICDFYSRGNCEDILTEAEKRTNGIINAKGYVTQAEVVRIQNKTDFLLSIGNKLTGEDKSLPSKILEYIAIGKPIIHVYGGKNDSAVKYLERYGLACIINSDDEMDFNVNKLIRFITENKGKCVPFDKVMALFPENTPDYTAEIIERFLSDKDEVQN